MVDRITVGTLRERKYRGEPLAGLTAYDYPTAIVIDRAGLDLLLVGDTFSTSVPTR